MTCSGKILKMTAGCVAALWAMSVMVYAENWWDADTGTTSAVDGIETTRTRVGDNTVVNTATRQNWTDGYIEVMAGATADPAETISLAHAYSVATKTARHLAYEKLGETVTGINLYSDATYDRELMLDANLRTVLRAMIRNARVVKEQRKQFNDGSIWVEVTLGMKLYGNDGLVQPSMDWLGRNAARVYPAPEPAPAAPPTDTDPEESRTPAVPPVADNTVYTGLIIDARKLNAQPAMLPKVYAHNGSILYGTGKIDKNYIVRYGLMGYQKELQAARDSERTGDNPLIVTAREIKGSNRSDFVLTLADTLKVQQALQLHDFFNECRVVAVLN